MKVETDHKQGQRITITMDIPAFKFTINSNTLLKPKEGDYPVDQIVRALTQQLGKGLPPGHGVWHEYDIVQRTQFWDAVGAATVDVSL